MHLRTPVALAVALSASLAAHAQSTASEGDYVVTASRTAEPAAAALRPVTVITAEDIRQSGAGSLTELLRTLGGVEVTSNGGLGQSSSVFIRGANSEHTVVLVDGIRIGSATLGTASLEGLPLALIERIEVLPGAASSLYGSDAIGGVIQIFTRSAQRSPGTTVAATAGSHALRQLTAAHASRLGADTEIALGLNLLSNGGIDVTTPDAPYGIHNGDHDGLVQRSAQARLSQRLNADHTLALTWLQARSKADYDDGDTVNAYSSNLQQTLGLRWNGRLGETWRSELSAARSQDQSDDHGSFPGYIDTTQDQVSWLNHLPVLGGTATAGLEWLRQRVDSSTDYDVDQRTVRSGLVGWRGQWDAFSLQADVREDRNSQFGHHSTGQLAGAWQFDPAWRARAAWSSAFHAPSFNQLYYPGFGDPTLKPEQSDNVELGLDGRAAGLDLGATVFDNRVRDLIDYDRDTFEIGNIAHARTRGLTLKAAGLVLNKATRFKANLTWQNPRNEDDDVQLRRRARVYGGLHLTHTVGPWQLGSDLSWVGRRYDNQDATPEGSMGAYGLVAVFGSWAVTPEWRLEARVNNLTDKSYATALGYRAPGREGQVTLRWTPAF